MFGGCGRTRHHDVATLTGNARLLATFNSYADAEARKVVVARARHALYQKLFMSCHADKEAAIGLAGMHIAIAQAFVEVDRPRRVCPDPVGFQVVDRGARLVGLEAGPQVHDAFSGTLVGWLRELQWYRLVRNYWQVIYDTGVLPPPFWYEGKWS